MKKLLLAAGIALSMSANVIAQDEQTGNSNAANAASGFAAQSASVKAAVVAGVGAAAIVLFNSSGTDVVIPPIECDPNQELVDGVCVDIDVPDVTCEGDDALVDGVCIGTTVTSTVIGTVTTTVPITFTYLPTVN